MPPFNLSAYVALTYIIIGFTCALDDSTIPTSTASIDTPFHSTPETVNFRSRRRQQTRSLDTSTANFLSCDSYLRIYFPQYFTHCICQYSDFSDWEISSLRSVPIHQCASGNVVVESRRRQDIQGACQDYVQERTAECAPEEMTRLALLLGLGSHGQNTASFTETDSPVILTENSIPDGEHPLDIPDSAPPLPTDTGRLFLSFPIVISNSTIIRRSTRGGTGTRICPNYGRRKRSVQMNENYNIKESQIPNNSLPEPQPLKEKPVPFDINLHGNRYRRQGTCTHQYVLFLLDTSGSIGQETFCKTNCALGNLVQWFCNPVSLAVMTFSHNFHREFCFSFDNDCTGRKDTKSAMRNIGYRGGLTYTSEAVECAFDEMLQSDCGFSGDYSCLSIVTITDGKSNGRPDVCSVIENKRRMYNVKTYSIGIGNTNQTELECLASEPHRLHLLQYSNYTTFIRGMETLHFFLQMESDSVAGDYACANTIYTANPFGTSQCPIERDPC